MKRRRSPSVLRSAQRVAFTLLVIGSVAIEFTKFPGRRPGAGLHSAPYSPRDLTILMVMYNKGRYLNRSLNSIFRLPIDRSRIEITLVDDASTDNTTAVAALFQNTDSRIGLYCLARNVGTHQSRIFAVRLVRTPFLTFLDPDDEYTGTGLSEALKIITTEEADIVEFGCHTVLPKRIIRYCWLRPRVRTATKHRLSALFYKGRINCHLHRKIFRSAVYHDAIHSMPEYVLQSRILRYEDKLHFAFFLDRMTRQYRYVPTLGEYRYWGLEDNSQSEIYQSVNESLANDNYVSWIINVTFGRAAQ
jgi:glycosyltransferase involved in cell wall biosynthesis